MLVEGESGRSVCVRSRRTRKGGDGDLLEGELASRQYREWGRETLQW